MNWNSKTIETYDRSAEALAEYFRGIGPRVGDIELALKLANATTSARVVEMGCGDGRDAVEIIKRVGWYEGFDPSRGLLKIARQKLPRVTFVQADALTYDYADDLDVIYAFASLLHINKADLKVVFERSANALRQGGVFYISLKERDAYAEEVKQDEYGERMFYYYNVPVITELADDKLQVVHEAHQRIGKTDWFTIALKKR